MVYYSPEAQADERHFSKMDVEGSSPSRASMALGVKVKDRRKWRNRIFRKKSKGLTGIWYNVKTRQYEKRE